MFIRCFHCRINYTPWPSVVSCRHVLFCMCGSWGQQGTLDYPRLLPFWEDTNSPPDVKSSKPPSLMTDICTTQNRAEHFNWYIFSHVRNPCSKMKTPKLHIPSISPDPLVSCRPDVLIHNHPQYTDHVAVLTALQLPSNTHSQNPIYSRMQYRLNVFSH